MITFRTETDTCPKCGAPLMADASLVVEGMDASISPFGTITEEDEEGPDLVLDDGTPDIVCKSCNEGIGEIFVAEVE